MERVINYSFQNVAMKGMRVVLGRGSVEGMFLKGWLKLVHFIPQLGKESY